MNILEKLIKEVKEKEDYKIYQTLMMANDEFVELLKNKEECMETVQKIEAGLLESYDKVVKIANNLSDDVTEEEIVDNFIEGALDADKETRSITLIAIIKDELDK